MIWNAHDGRENRQPNAIARHFVTLNPDKTVYFDESWSVSNRKKCLLDAQKSMLLNTSGLHENKTRNPIRKRLGGMTVLWNSRTLPN